MSFAQSIVRSLLALSFLGCQTTGLVLDVVDAAVQDQPVDGGTPLPGANSSDAIGSGAIGSDASGSDASGSDASTSDASRPDGSYAQPPSCLAGAAGTVNCGANSESCCTSLAIIGGTFSRVYVNNGGGATGLASPANVSGFRLDKYDVTVGRFRPFATASAAGYTPPAGSGKHTHLNDGQGLKNSAASGSYEPGWVMSDNAYVAPTSAMLSCDPTHETWTTAPAGNENLPVNCANWYEAYAFCIWDGGFLPSEAEWEYAAAGGIEQREYPWGNAPPGTASQYAIYGYYYPSGIAIPAGVSNIAPVGTATAGAARWGQLDLVGEVYQWNLDYFADYVDPCADCASTTTVLPMPTRIRRGGAFGYDPSLLNPALRQHDSAGARDNNFGIRCARTP